MGRVSKKKPRPGRILSQPELRLKEAKKRCTWLEQQAKTEAAETGLPPSVVLDKRIRRLQDEILLGKLRYRMTSKKGRQALKVAREIEGNYQAAERQYKADYRRWKILMELSKRHQNGPFSAKFSAEVQQLKDSMLSVVSQSQEWKKLHQQAVDIILAARRDYVRIFVELTQNEHQLHLLQLGTGLIQ